MVCRVLLTHRGYLPAFSFISFPGLGLENLFIRRRPPAHIRIKLAPHACSAVQLVAVWSDQAVGPSGFPAGDGMISPAILSSCCTAPEERSVGRDSLYGCAFEAGRDALAAFALSPVLHVSLKRVRRSGKKGLDLLPDVLRTAT